jgi:hypothetical protein
MKVTHYSLLTGFGILALAATLLSNSNGPQAAVAGSPLEGGNDCTQCHGGTVNSGPGTLEVGGVEAYAPGETYTITVNVNDESSSKFGFQAIAVDENNNAVGTITPGTGSKTITSGGNEYVEHSSPSTSGAFTFEWTAPATDVGDITFYASGNASNGNNQVSGDNIYTNTLTATPTQVGIENKLTFNEVANIINLGNGSIQISALNDQDIEVEIYNLNGQLISQSNQSVSNLDLGQGVFVVKAILSGNVYTQKVAL